MSFIPCLRYRKPADAIVWLERAFGLRRLRVIEDANGGIEHAELRLGDAVMMLGGPKRSAIDRHYVMPRDIGGLQTQSTYAVVEDVAVHLDRAKAGGARIVQPLTQEPYGQIYSAVDCEGHIWSFGDYDPLASEPHVDSGSPEVLPPEDATDGSV